MMSVVKDASIPTVPPDNCDGNDDPGREGCIVSTAVHKYTAAVGGGERDEASSVPGS